MPYINQSIESYTWPITLQEDFFGTTDVIRLIYIYIFILYIYIYIYICAKKRKNCKNGRRICGPTPKGLTGVQKQGLQKNKQQVPVIPGLSKMSQNMVC